jgi:hypothetical protein
MATFAALTFVAGGLLARMAYVARRPGLPAEPVPEHILGRSSR